MVNGQILTNKVTDEALTDALLAVPRDRFVPDALAGAAYVDEDIAVGGDRFLMEPMVFARMVQAAELNRDDLVLDIGCATGYSCAVLAALADTVVGLEVDEDMVARANALLNELEIENAAVIAGPLQDGRADQGPYDLIFVNGSVARIPDALLAQLKDSGRLIAIERRGHIGQAIVFA